MAKNVAKILDKIEGNLKLQQEKLKLLRENMSCIEYWEDHNDGGFWKPLTEEKAAKFANDHWELNELRLSLYYLVKTDVGIRILNAEEYATYMGNTIILYQGSYTACKDFVKV
jgi:hypothetical protein